MSLLLLSIAFVTAVLLVLISFAQILYLESLRLRPRELPALDFFKEHVEERLGMKAERGALSFTLAKHTLVVVMTLLIVAGLLADGEPAWQRWVEISLLAWFAMVAVSYLVPQLLYRRTEGRWMPAVAPLWHATAVLTRPIVVPLEFVQSLMESVNGNGHDDEAPTPAENIEALIEAGAEEGLIEEHDRRLIQSVMEFGDKTVREVMTPRPNIVASQGDATLEELRQLVVNEQYSRIPVYGESIDDIIGFVHARDMFELDPGARGVRHVREIMRPIRFVPETKLVNALMREMQRENAHMVIVVDEYGNTAGLATMEDLVEVIVGEIFDEHEPASDITEEEGAIVVSGSFDLARLHDLFDFRPEEELESTTIGGLVTEWLGHVPAAGESVEREGLRIEVLASNGMRVEKVRVRKSEAVAHE